ncbi:hypothetical protein [Bacillus sp. UMB0728]|uniref:hypothetical protein n=1 Tax=Bacillus sp. UMB0728 TaxID=2066052 RepID=UPI000C786741|nr:hypothetical protein [Bacillus sp. UMB0728]PLR72311.1 hypothetical protein CYJ37_12200 [Bacillus sp. UMB0728]
MAEKKTPAKRKAPAKKAVEETQIVEKAEEVTETPAPTPKRKQKVEIDRNELVSCRNVTDGQLIYKSRKNGLTTVWMNHGDTEYLEVAELLTMKASQPKFLNDVWLVIDDEDVVEFLGLKHIYKNIVDIDDVDSFFDKSPSDMAEALTKLPKGLQDTIGTRARKLIESGELYDTRKISALEEALKIELKMFVE